MSVNSSDEEYEYYSDDEEESSIGQSKLLEAIRQPTPDMLIKLCKTPLGKLVFAFLKFLSL